MSLPAGVDSNQLAALYAQGERVARRTFFQQMDTDPKHRDRVHRVWITNALVLHLHREELRLRESTS